MNKNIIVTLITSLIAIVAGIPSLQCNCSKRTNETSNEISEEANFLHTVSRTRMFSLPSVAGHAILDLENPLCAVGVIVNKTLDKTFTLEFSVSCEI